MSYLFKNSHDKSTRGAKVFGIPVCNEVLGYMENVFPDYKQKRKMSMFFCEDYVSLNSDSPEEDVF